MTARHLATLAWGVCAAAALATLVFLVMGVGQATPGDDFGLSGWGGLSFVIASLAFATVGALVAARLPENRIGWLFCVTGVAMGIGDLAYQYADQVLYGSARGLPAGDVAAWLQNLGVPPAFGLLGLALLLFPDGHVPSRRWRPAVVPGLVGVAFVVIGYALRPGALDEPFETVVNPLGVPGAFGLMDVVANFGWIFMGAGVALAALAMRSRLRRARGFERQQLKWIAFAASIAGVVIVAAFASFFLSAEGINALRIVALGIACSAFPVASGVAILRYRLYDIDVVINRTLVYGALTATLAGSYIGGVLLLQLALSGVTEGSGLAVAASTLGVAALFRPARTRIQEVVDRRFFRRKYDAAQTLERFGAHLRVEVDLDALRAELRSIVADTMQPAHVSVWLRPPTAGP